MNRISKYWRKNLKSLILKAINNIFYRWEMMGKEILLERQIRELEERLLQPEIRKSRKDLLDLLADDFIEFGSMGRIYDRQQIIEELHDESPLKMELDNFSIKCLSSDIVLARYHLTVSSDAHEPAIHSLRSSIWVLRDTVWQIVFHQGTLMK